MTAEIIPEAAPRRQADGRRRLLAGRDLRLAGEFRAVLRAGCDRRGASHVEAAMMAPGPQIAELVVTFAVVAALPMTFFACVFEGRDRATTTLWFRVASMIATLWFAVTADSGYVVAISAVLFLAMPPFHLRACHQRARLRGRLARRFGDRSAARLIKLPFADVMVASRDVAGPRS